MLGELRILVTTLAGAISMAWLVDKFGWGPAFLVAAAYFGVELFRTRTRRTREPAVSAELTAAPEAAALVEELDALRCAFCGRHRRDAELLVQGPNVCICAACVELCRRFVMWGRNEKRPRLSRWAW